MKVTSEGRPFVPPKSSARPMKHVAIRKQDAAKSTQYDGLSQFIDDALIGYGIKDAPQAQPTPWYGKRDNETVVQQGPPPTPAKPKAEPVGIVQEAKTAGSAVEDADKIENAK